MSAPAGKGSAVGKGSAEGKPVEPLGILIGALGGEGGGLLTDWLLSAAMAADFPVQSTSIPGVAQRTGATTYYLEIYPVPRAQLNGREPVLALYPSPGRIDLAVASELLEAGRIVENGFVSPERTVMVASTHRIFTIAEKSALGDGRFDTSHLPDAIRQMSRRALLFDLAQTAKASGSAINAVMLGLIVGSGALPLAVEAFERSIQDKGVAVESNLRGLRAGIQLAARGAEGAPLDAAGQDDQPAPDAASVPALPAALAERIERDFPGSTRDILRLGAARLVDFQGRRYADLFLNRLGPLLACETPPPAGQPDHELTREAGRQLALWMSYEDAIRVADLKTRPGRFRRIRAEVGAKPGEPVRITEFLDPGIEEIAAILPPLLARPLLWVNGRFPALAAFRRPMKVRTDTVSGFLKLWVMARLRRLRPWTQRYRDEQALIERWLAGVAVSAAADYALGLEAAKCARLLKGYGETYHRGRDNFDAIFSRLIEPGAANGGSTGAAEAVRLAREAALADPDGNALEQALEKNTGL